ncbi:MAG: L-alanine-DL-glutamate epimerase-like enolase superfamily enzyme [Planctomycetota bacterium]|jgi:L-alanine-DL-glutamate epimerase-like enolase superfamily enzyme
MATTADTERGQVKITGIKAMQLQKHPQTLIKIETDAGLVGYGEAGTHGPIVRAHLDKEILPLLIGQDPLDIELHYERMVSQQHPNMPNIPTVSGVDIALWDLAGKILHRPVSKLLNGRYRDTVPLYTNTAPQDRADKASCNEWVQKLKEDAHGWQMLKVGFPMMGRQIGKASRMLLPSEIREIGRGFDNVREALGDDFDFIVHCHNEWDLPTAINACQVLASCEPMWIEDPLPVPYDDTWKALREASPIRVITGEKLELPRQFYSFLANEALDAIHPDIVFAGGFTGCRRIAQLAELFYIPVATHNIGTLVHTMATVHFGATVRDFVATESRIGQGVFIEEMGVHDLEVADGHIAVPDRPGLGVELVEEVLKENLAEGEPYWD